jgi:lipopolysaccharide assembly LptE-like protein
MPIRRPFNSAIFLGLLLLTVFGCGYQSSLEKAPPSYVIKEPEEGKENFKTLQRSRITIPVFVNKTFEPLIENTLTLRFRQQILRDGHLKLVSSEENSDLTLEGQLNSFGQTPLSFDTNNAALEYRISLILQMSLKDAKTKKILWQKSGITGTSDYYVNADSSLNRAALDRALDEAITVLAEDVISEILDLYR